MSNVRDVTNEGIDDLITGGKQTDPSSKSLTGKTYLVSGADLALYAFVDGNVGVMIDLSNIAKFCF